MNVMKPPLIWIENRCYRKNPVKCESIQSSAEEIDLYPEVVVKPVKEEIDEDIDIEEIEGGKFKAILSIPSNFFSYIVGKKGATKIRIEQETDTRIFVPRQGQQGDVEITGLSKNGVASAYTRLELVASSLRQKIDFTHFLSLPLNADDMKNAFLEFKDDVLRTCDGARGLNEKIFQNPCKLHLTLGTLVMLNETERKKGAKILMECQEEIIRPLLQDAPLILIVEGIEYMNDSPGEVSVLYAKVKEHGSSERLQKLADKLAVKFEYSGFMQQQYDRVKLHATLMNTLFGSNTDNSSYGHQRNQRETFDARPILKKFENHYFAKVRIPSIDISLRHSVDQDNYYKCSAKLELP